jgi:hypothetical protein
MLAFNIRPDKSFGTEEISFAVLKPTDDTYATDKSLTVHGLEPTIIFNCFTQPGEGSNEEFFKFNLSVLPNNIRITSAKLCLYTFWSIGPPYTGSLTSFWTATDDWDEGTLNWNNKPPFGTGIGSFYCPQSYVGWLCWENQGLIDYANQEYSGDKLLSLHSTCGVLEVYSKDNELVEYQPYLNITYETLPPPPSRIYWRNQGENTSTPLPGESVALYAQGFGDKSLDLAYLETNETGEWKSSLSEASFFNLNTLNDSSASENVTFTGSENKTLWIRLPKDSFVFEAKMNLSEFASIEDNGSFSPKNAYLDVGNEGNLDWKSMSPITTFSDGTSFEDYHYWAYNAGQNITSYIRIPKDTTVVNSGMDIIGGVNFGDKRSWDCGAQNTITTIVPPTGTPRGLAADDNRLYVGTSSNKTYIYDYSWNLVGTLDCTNASYVSNSINAIMLDYNYIYLGCEDGGTRIFYENNYTLVNTIQVNSSVSWIFTSKDEPLLYIVHGNYLDTFDKMCNLVSSISTTNGDNITRVEVDADYIYVMSHRPPGHNSIDSLLIYNKTTRGFIKSLTGPQSWLNFPFYFGITPNYIVVGASVYNRTDSSFPYLFSLPFSGCCPSAVGVIWVDNWYWYGTSDYGWSQGGILQKDAPEIFITYYCDYKLLNYMVTSTNKSSPSSGFVFTDGGPCVCVFDKSYTPRNCYVVIGDGSKSWNRTESLDPSNSPMHIVLDSNDFNDYLSSHNVAPEGYCDVPIRFFSNTQGFVRLEYLYLTLSSRTANLRSPINDYLSKSIPDANGWCYVPLVLHSDARGVIQISDINITYARPVPESRILDMKSVANEWVWSNFTWQNASIPAKTAVGWRIHYKDILGNENVTDTMSFTVQVPPSAFALAVTNVTPSKTIVGQGYSMNINVTVSNQGDFTEAFNLTAYADTTIIETKEVTLANSVSTTIFFTWNTAGFAYGNYTISAVADTIPGETDTTNNNFTNGKIYVGIPGDINGDETVDVFDAVMLAGAAGAKPGDRNWNPNADINNDQIVDLFDAAILAGHAGEHYL